MSQAKTPVRRLHAHDHFAGRVLPLSVAWQEVTQMVSPHDHDFYELALITRGRGEHITSRRRVLTTAGDVWFVRPGHWHTYMNVRRLGVFNCLIGPALFRSLTPSLQRDAGAVQLFWRGPVAQARDGCCLLRLEPRRRLEAERALGELQAALARGAPAAALEARGRLWIFLSLLARAAAEQAAARPDAREASSPLLIPRHEAAAAAVELIEAHYAEEQTAGQLAQEVGVSVPHLNRLFRAMTGMSPLCYRACVRAQRACLLLASTGKSVTEIAGAVGWPDPNLFARRFKTLIGMAPTRYRGVHRASAQTSAAT